jgi:hypothetical protein
MEGLRSPDTVRFSDDAICVIAAALPPNSPSERLKLLPQILRAWAVEDLHEHLFSEGRATAKLRKKQLQSLGKRAHELIRVFAALDDSGFFNAAFETQMRRAGTTVLDTDVTAAEQRRADGLAWLADLAATFDIADDVGQKRLRPPGPKAMRNYLVVRDLAAIFTLVSGEPATRRSDPATGKTVGPFWDFAKCVWVEIFGTSFGLAAALKGGATEVARQRRKGEAARQKLAEAGSLAGVAISDVALDAAETRFREYSPFVANIQFRHPEWRDLIYGPS